MHAYCSDQFFIHLNVFFTNRNALDHRTLCGYIIGFKVSYLLLMFVIFLHCCYILIAVLFFIILFLSFYILYILSFVSLALLLRLPKKGLYNRACLIVC